MRFRRAPAADDAPPDHNPDRRRVRLALSLAAYAMGVEPAALDTADRGPAPVAFARQLGMYLAHVAFELSLQRIAVSCGRDRSTVAHACHLIEDRREAAGFDAWVEQLERALAAAPPPAAQVPLGRGRS